MDPADLVHPGDLRAFASGKRHTPHALLGAHRAELYGAHGVIVRGYHADAVGCELLREGAPPIGMLPVGEGMFAVFVAGADLPLVYRLRFHFKDGAT